MGHVVHFMLTMYQRRAVCHVVVYDFPTRKRHGQVFNFRLIHVSPLKYLLDESINQGLKFWPEEWGNFDRVEAWWHVLWNFPAPWMVVSCTAEIKTGKSIQVDGYSKPWVLKHARIENSGFVHFILPSHRHCQHLPHCYTGPLTM